MLWPFTREGATMRISNFLGVGVGNADGIDETRYCVNSDRR